MTRSKRGRSGRGTATHRNTPAVKRSRSKKIKTNSQLRNKKKTFSCKIKNTPDSSRRPWEDSDDDSGRPDFYSSDSASEDSFIDDFDYTNDEVADDTSSLPDELDNRECYDSASSSDEIPICPWMEIPPEKLPKLELPPSSSDLFLDTYCLFDALEIYETCISFYRTVRISPFLFEDFCAALQSSNHTSLLAEIHIALLKSVLKDDEDEQILLSVQDTNNSFNVMIQLLEPMTYAEVLRQYIESDPKRFSSEVLRAVSGNYPFTSVKNRLTVLSWLCDRFLHSQEFKNIVRNEGKFVSDEHCRECGKPGDLLLCDECEASYHISCANLNSAPDGQWQCSVCILHKVRGVTDCYPFESKSQRQPLRLSPIGYDRHGRRYWFLVRRIFVQNDIDKAISYYSTLPQVYNLVSRFAVNDLEKELSANLLELLPLINEHMRITIELTIERNITQTDSYLTAENLFCMRELLSKPLGKKLCKLSEEKAEYGKMAIEQEKNFLAAKIEELLGFTYGHLVDSFWTAGLTRDEVLSRGNNLKPKLNFIPKTGFCLGDDILSSQFVNQFVANDYAKNPYLRAKERDRKKYLCSRFALGEEHAFEWYLPREIRSIFGSVSETGSVIHQTLHKILLKIPTTLMHRLWKRDGLAKFTEMISVQNSIKALKAALLLMECGIRRPVFSNVWWGTLGHVKLMRMTPADREWRQKIEKRKKKMDRDMINADPYDDNEIITVKYTIRQSAYLRHNLFRQKDEHYRICGRKALGGWIWISSTLVRRYLPTVEKPSLGIISDHVEKKELTTADKKAIRLEEVVQQLSQKLAEKMKTDPDSSEKNSEPPINDTDQPSTCKSDNIKFNRTQNESSVNEKKENGGDIMGVDKPFPLPVPFDFKTRQTGKQSLLVLPPRVLKKLARQGGLSFNYYPPGFHKLAKSNVNVWNYPCQRPLFDHCWKFLTLRAQSYHAVALQLRILFACIRWADMERDSSESPHVVMHHPDYDEVRTIIGHKEWPPDGLYEQYKLEVRHLALDDYSDDDVDGSIGEGSSYRSGRNRKRKTAAKQKSLSLVNLSGHYKVNKKIEKWIDGVDLKLWEISNYWKEKEINTNRPSLPRQNYTGRTSIPLSSIDRKPQFIFRNDTSSVRRFENYSNRPNIGFDNHYVMQNHHGIRTEVPIARRCGIYENSNFSSVPPRYSGILIGGGRQTEPTDQEHHNSEVNLNLTPSDTHSTSVPRISTIPTPQNVSNQYCRVNVPITSNLQRQGINTQRIVYTTPQNIQNPRPMNAKVILLRRTDGTARYVRSSQVFPGERMAVTRIPGGNNLVLSSRPSTSRSSIPGVPLRRAGEGVRCQPISQPGVLQNAPNIGFSRGGTQVSLSTNPDSRVTKIIRLSPLNSPFSQRSVRIVPSAVRQAAYRNEMRIPQMHGNDLLVREVVSDRRSTHVKMENVSRFQENLGEDDGTDLIDVGDYGAPQQSRSWLSAIRQSEISEPIRQSKTEIESPQNLNSGDYYRPVSPPSANFGRDLSTQGSYKVVRPRPTSYLRTHDEYSDQDSSEPLEFQQPAAVPHMIQPKEEGESSDIAEELLEHVDCSSNNRSHLYEETAESIGLKKEVNDDEEDLLADQHSDNRKDEADDKEFSRFLDEHTLIFQQSIHKHRAKFLEKVDADIALSRALQRRKPNQNRNKRARLNRPDNVTMTPLDPSEIALRSKNIDLKQKEEEENEPKFNEDKTTSEGSDDDDSSRKSPARSFSGVHRGIQQNQAHSSTESHMINPENTLFRGKVENLERMKANDEAIGSCSKSAASSDVKKFESINKRKRKLKLKQTVSKKRASSTSKISTKDDRVSESDSDSIDQTINHCICNQPYDPNKFYVRCDLCNRWFHGKCIKITVKKSKTMTEWSCADCSKDQKKTEEELFCICRTPNDSKRGYVGCDRCDGWFHLECVGITQAEVDAKEEYVCPNCAAQSQSGYESNASTSSGPNLHISNFSPLLKLVGALDEHRLSWPFKKFVIPDEDQNYHRLIETPMDLTIIRNKLEKKAYRTLWDFTADVALIFENARKINEEKSQIYNCADILEKFFRDELLKLKKTMR